MEDRPKSAIFKTPKLVATPIMLREFGLWSTKVSSLFLDALEGDTCVGGKLNGGIFESAGYNVALLRFIILV